ncbi:MAG: flagellar export protein FliJ [Anaerovoracaceae bacterium]|jgi:flagellar FliJ protein
MKKFNFRFEKIHSYKGQMLDSEIMVLAVLNNKLAAAERKLCHMEEEMECCSQDLENKITGNTTPAMCRIYIEYMDHLKKNIKEEEKNIEQIKAEIAEEIEVIKGLKLETKSLETLRDVRYDEYVKDNLKKEELHLEEYISTARVMQAIV